MDPYVRDRWRRTRYHGHGGLVGGVILASIGVLLLLQNLNIPGFEDLERYWPVILIVVGVAQAARSVGMGGRIWGGALFLVGAIFLLNNFNIIRGDVWRFLWPGVLIMVGLAMLARAIDRQSDGGEGRASAAADAKKMGEDIRNRIINDWGGKGSATSVNHLNEWAIFGGARRRVDSQDFQGGEAFAMFGGVEIDLRRAASTRPEILLEANALFGGVEIRVPETWNVTVRGSGIFGGARRRVDSQDFQGGEAFAMFGGVEIDLRRAASTRPEILLEANALFGGVEIRVPETWNVTVRGSGIFGGYEDKTLDSRAAPDAKQPHLIVNGFAIFGGVTIQN